MTDLRAINGWVVVDPIYTPPTSQSKIINPVTNLSVGGEYHDHPFRALCIVAPQYFFNGGLKYESEVQKGDIVLLPGEVVEKQLMSALNEVRPIWIDGVMYIAIRYQHILSVYTPTEEERKGLKFERIEKAKTIKELN